MSAADRGIIVYVSTPPISTDRLPLPRRRNESGKGPGSSPGPLLFLKFYGIIAIMGYDGETDVLAQMLVDEKIRGRSYLDIAQKHGLPVEEVITIVRGYYAATTIRDPQEHRALLQLRLERIIDKLWEGLEAGSFKHGEAIIKAVTQLQDLHDLNEQHMTTAQNLIMDEDTDTILEVLKHATGALRDRVARMPLSKKAKEELTAWPEWAAEATTNAVEEVIYAEVVEE